MKVILQILFTLTVLFMGTAAKSINPEALNQHLYDESGHVNSITKKAGVSKPPQNLDDILSSPLIQSILSNKTIQAVLADPMVSSVLKNPKVQKVLKNPIVHSILMSDSIDNIKGVPLLQFLLARMTGIDSTNLNNVHSQKEDNTHHKNTPNKWMNAIISGFDQVLEIIQHYMARTYKTSNIQVIPKRNN